MMKRLLSIAFLIVLPALTGFAQEVCKRHVEVGYSMCVPPNWRVEAREGQKYKLFFAPADEQFTSNINVRDEPNPASLVDYAAASVKYVLDNYQQIGATSIKVISQTNFQTTSGIQGIRVAYSSEFKGIQVKTLQYYFSGKGTQKWIVTCTYLEAKATELDTVFDRAVKSLQIDK